MVTCVRSRKSKCKKQTELTDSTNQMVEESNIGSVQHLLIIIAIIIVVIIFVIVIIIITKIITTIIIITIINYYYFLLLFIINMKVEILYS